jgi:hypothetical protein
MKSFFVLTFFLCSIAGHTQMKGFSIGPYAEYGVPTGNLQQTHKNGLGAGFGADIPAWRSSQVAMSPPLS